MNILLVLGVAFLDMWTINRYLLWLVGTAFLQKPLVLAPSFPPFLSLVKCHRTLENLLHVLCTTNQLAHSLTNYDIVYLPSFFHTLSNKNKPSLSTYYYNHVLSLLYMGEKENCTMYANSSHYIFTLMIDPSNRILLIAFHLHKYFISTYTDV